MNIFVLNLIERVLNKHKITKDSKSEAHKNSLVLLGEFYKHNGIPPPKSFPLTKVDVVDAIYAIQVAYGYAMFGIEKGKELLIEIIMANAISDDGFQSAEEMLQVKRTLELAARIPKH